MICNSSERNILLSGDVELNPGPATAENTSAVKEVSSSDPDFVLKCRMIRYRLTPLNVGGGGDCLFKSVSHQLCGDSSHHLELRATGVRFLTDNPERFIESNTETSWLQYLSRMSIQGTWADNIVIQAVADSMNLKIYIIESDDNFRDVTIVEPANTVENPQSIYIGHIGQVHYVSSCSALCGQNSNEIDKDHFSTSVLNDRMEDDNTQSLQTESDRNVANSCNGNLSTNQNKITETCELSNNRKRQQKRAAYMRQYRMTNISPEKRQNVMRTREIIGQQMHLQRKKQSVMRIREIIGQQMNLQRKKPKRNENQRN